MNIKAILFLNLVAGWLIAAAADAKVISPSDEQGENRISIRADGLACYFCAYGMERFFKQSGRIAWYDMKMAEGIVEVGFIKGKPILDVRTLKQYVHDAGFSPREIKAKLVGRLTPTDEGYRFRVTETDQTFPVETNAVVRAARELVDQEVTVIARVQEVQDAPLKLVPEAIRPKKLTP
ncbi:MAG: hypothetical protein AB1451_06385 [Nitrospirota bacterium]